MELCAGPAIMWGRSWGFLRKLTVAQLIVKLTTYLERESPLPSSQKPFVGPCLSNKNRLSVRVWATKIVCRSVSEQQKPSVGPCLSNKNRLSVPVWATKTVCQSVSEQQKPSVGPCLNNTNHTTLIL